MSRPSNAAVVLDEDTTNSIKTIIKEAAKAGLGAECMSVGEYALALIGDINVGPAIDIAYGNSIKCYQQERHLKLMIRTMIADGDLQLRMSGIVVNSDEMSFSA